MKKILLLICIITVLPIHSKGIEKGYHGNAEVDYIAPLGLDCYNWKAFEVLTTHGYQFNNYFFIGAGVGFTSMGEITYGNIDGKPYNKRESKCDVPVFFNTNIHFTKTKVSPFLDAKLGTITNNDHGLYFNVSIGGRYAINDKMGISLSFGYQQRDAQLLVFKSKVIITKYSSILDEYYEKENKKTSLGAFTFKIGFDF